MATELVELRFPGRIKSGGDIVISVRIPHCLTEEWNDVIA